MWQWEIRFWSIHFHLLWQSKGSCIYLQTLESCFCLYESTWKCHKREHLFKIAHVERCSQNISSWLSLSCLKGALSRYFEVFWPSTNLPLNWRKPENNALQRLKNTKEIIINHKGTRMVKDGEGWHGLQTTKLKSLAKLFKPI